MRQRILFVLEELTRDAVSVRGILNGREATMGMVSSCLLVVERLAQRKHPVALLILGNKTLSEHSFPVFADMESARRWIGAGRTIWCSWGHYATLERLNAAGFRPVLWMHNHLEPGHPAHVPALERGQLAGIITVSDRARLTWLHTAEYQRLGRVHNPLNPFYAQGIHAPAERYATRRIIYAGGMRASKGAHRILQTWLQVRERLPGASLILAGSVRLHRQDYEVGPLGVAEPQFEQNYLEPLVRRFGSLAAAGIELTGLLSPAELRELYGRCALGLVNFNWDEDSETFSCAGVEMLACKLPVFSVARGALPETLGATGGAVLCRSPRLDVMAEQMAELLESPDRLRELGETGSRYVRTRFDLDRIVDQWERILAGDLNDLYRNTTPWSCDRPLRYWVERLAGRMKCGAALESTAAILRRLRGKTRQHTEPEAAVASA